MRNTTSISYRPKLRQQLVAVFGSGFQVPIPPAWDFFSLTVSLSVVKVVYGQY